MSPPDVVFEGTVHIKGDLIVDGTIDAYAHVKCNELRVKNAMIRLGGDDSDTTQDLTIFRQPNCGSGNDGPALVLQPVSPFQGALLLLIPGEECPPGSILAQLMAYGPYHPGNPRRQRITCPTIFRQSDGNPFACIDSTMSGEGDPQGIYEMPLLHKVAELETARMSVNGFTIKPPYSE